MFTQKRILITIGIEAAKAALVVVVALLLIRFAAGEIARIGHDHLERQQIIAFAGLPETRLEQTEDDLARAYAYEKVVENAIPPVERIGDVITAIEEHAAANGLQKPLLTFGSIAPVAQTLPDGTSLSEVPFSLTVQGSFDAVRAYAADLEHLPYFLGIERVTLSAASAKTDLIARTQAVFTGFLFTK